MIVVKRGDIFDSDCDVLVNPVNSVGIMGVGLAKLFRQKFPTSCNAYNTLSIAINPDRTKLINPSLFFEKNKFILMFPTKIHWKNDSTYSYIQTSIEASREILKEHGNPSIAFPPVGCGYGRLNIDMVFEIIKDRFSDYENVIEFYRSIQ